MCGRYSLIADLRELAQRFAFDGDWLAFESPCNVSSPHRVLVVEVGESRCAGLHDPGLILLWARDLSVSSWMLDAKANTVGERHVFRVALRTRLRLVFADEKLRRAASPTAEDLHLSNEFRTDEP